MSTATHPCPIDADLWVLAGQSNMEGCGAIVGLEPTDPRILAFNMDNRWVEAAHPLHRLYEAAAPVHRALIQSGGMTDPQYEELFAQNRLTLFGGVGSGLDFARRVLECTGRPVALVPCSHGGSSMAQWSPALKDQGDQSLYGAMLERLRRIGRPVKGVLWYQGESDAIPEVVDKFEAAWLDFVDSLRRDLGQPDLPIIYVQIGRFTVFSPTLGQPWEQVREAQRRAADKRANLFMVGAADLPLDDPIHLSAASQRRLGLRLAETALTHVYGLPGHAMPIALERIEVLEPQALKPRLRLRFSGVNGRLRADGRPSDCELRSDNPPEAWPVAYRTDFDPDDPATLIVSIGAPLPEGKFQLFHGTGLNPYMNITDEKDMPLPAFGPVEVII